MQVAIETATIIASLMTALIKADLVFFNHKPLRPPIVPKVLLPLRARVVCARCVRCARVV